MLGFGVVVHQTVALAYLEVDAVLFSPIARHAVVCLLIALKSKGILLVLELLVGLCRNTVLRHGHSCAKEGHCE